MQLIVKKKLPISISNSQFGKFRKLIAKILKRRGRLKVLLVLSLDFTAYKIRFLCPTGFYRLSSAHKNMAVAHMCTCSFRNQNGEKEATCVWHAYKVSRIVLIWSQHITDSSVYCNPDCQSGWTVLCSAMEPIIEMNQPQFDTLGIVYDSSVQFQIV